MRTTSHRKVPNGRLLGASCLALSIACGPAVQGNGSGGASADAPDDSGAGGFETTGGSGADSSAGGGQATGGVTELTGGAGSGGSASGGGPSGVGGETNSGGTSGGSGTGGAGGSSSGDLARIAAFCDAYCAAAASVVECAPYPECTDNCDVVWPEYYSECPAEVMAVVTCTETTPGSLEWYCEDGVALAVDESCNSLTQAVGDCYR